MCTSEGWFHLNHGSLGPLRFHLENPFRPEMLESQKLFDGRALVGGEETDHSGVAAIGPRLLEFHREIRRSQILDERFQIVSAEAGNHRRSDELCHGGRIIDLSGHRKMSK